jgi:hypothetical protein
MTLAKNNFYFLSDEEASFFKALCELIVPSGKDPVNSPGAVDVGAVNYIDSTLFDFPKAVQDYYREIVKLTNEQSRQQFHEVFSRLNDSNKDVVLRNLFRDPETRERAFDLRSLVLESFYSDYHDPSYQGVTAWHAIQFEGKRISGITKDWTFLKVWRDFEKEKSGSS